MEIALKVFGYEGTPVVVTIHGTLTRSLRRWGGDERRLRLHVTTALPHVSCLLASFAMVIYRYMCAPSFGYKFTKSLRDEAMSLNTMIAAKLQASTSLSHGLE